MADPAQGRLSPANSSAPPPPSGEEQYEFSRLAKNSTRQWFILSRWQEYEGESRANALRLVAIGAFYAVELLRFHVLESASAERLGFHKQATLVAVAWTMLALGVALCLRMGIFPAALKYLSSAADVLLLTTLAALVAGPSSPLVLIYFPIIALAGLRLSVGLVWFVTAASMLGYWSLVGWEDMKTSRWFDAQHAVPPTTQLVTLLALAFAGAVLGQIVRRVPRIAAEYAERLRDGERAPT